MSANTDTAAQLAQERAADQAAAQVTLGRAARIVQTALGGDYWDTETVTDLGVGIAGHDDAAVWALGDWNDARTYDADARTWTTTDDTPSRLLAALERLGVDCWWSDQGAPCPECGKLVDTEPTFGTVAGIWVDCAGYVCLECVSLDLEAYTADYVNDADKALPSDLDASVLEAAGWERTDRDHRSGWYGREDSPAGILAEILEDDNDLEVVFQITSAHMFEVAFTVWTRTPGDDDDAN